MRNHPSSCTHPSMHPSIHPSMHPTHPPITVSMHLFILSSSFSYPPFLSHPPSLPLFPFPFPSRERLFAKAFLHVRHPEWVPMGSEAHGCLGCHGEAKGVWPGYWPREERVQSPFPPPRPKPLSYNLKKENHAELQDGSSF